MQIGPNSVVSIEYTLRDEDGEIIDTSVGSEPLTFIQGQNMLIPGLEKALEGKEPGEELRVLITAEEGYGEYDPEAVRVVKRDQFPADMDLYEGLEIYAETDDGHRQPGSVLAVNGEEISLDFNHPLAGENLDFEVKIHEVRAASAEELAHGHIHGPGGHHHD